jgi:hypothetical protein
MSDTPELSPANGEWRLGGESISDGAASMILAAQLTEARSEVARLTAERGEDSARLDWLFDCIALTATLRCDGKPARDFYITSRAEIDDFRRAGLSGDPHE